ncbi:dolichyl-phosphate-mannose--protein mannosyltransferase [Planotetraspora sp. GP83]|uniref:dolichyl-phosphate-mannose--protein mannosyltransferase n=1 Tax=Planotetraspora sp. GP83 TaxID=3156264 RepID=UPI003513F2CA
MPGSPLWGWLGPLIVALFGGFLRFSRLGTPKAVVFDETYYVKDAFSTIKYGVERHFVDKADDLLLSGNTHVFRTCDQADQCANFVAHPPLGKWMIGVGEWLFGLTPFGWRFVAALAGTISILILARTARRMTRSTVLGCLAGFLLALDGLHFVLSRTALLDIFLMFWVLAAFACLVTDRDHGRARLADWYQTSSLVDPGPRLGWRPWRLAAGLCLGAALATKWTGVFFIAAFAIVALVWDAGARRAIGLRRPYTAARRLDWPLGLAWLGVVPIVVYTASFLGWFVSADGWGRNWEEATSNGWAFFVFDSLRSWVSYQVQVLGFHEGLHTPHGYQSQPWGWPLLLRPVAFFYQSPKGVCGADNCSWAVLGTGTPVIWYAGVLALLALIAWYVASRDWRAGAVLLAYAAGWLPWFYFAIADHRTMYLFYALPMVPFMILAIVLVCGLIIGPVDAPSRRRVMGTAVVGAFALLALVNFWWLSPILAAEPIPYDMWFKRMFFRSWI